jgi:putative lipoic acid-binding regulatory protein
VSDGGNGSRRPGNEAAFDRLEQLLEFPVDFPMKVIGARVDEFADTVTGIVLAHAPDFDPATVQMRVSSKGAWLSLTVTIRAQSRAQLQGLHDALVAHPLVRMVL